MAYRFKASDRSVERAIRRIAREQVDGALNAITSLDRAVATHEVRKACKKVRALVRLVRPVFAEYAHENAEFRDIARLLSGSRDAKVLLDTFDLLVADESGQADRERLASLRQRLSNDLADLMRDEDSENRLEQARVLLEMAGERIGGWTLAGEGWEALGSGLGKVLRQARSAADRVLSEPTALHYHELRKLTKYHWYHARLFVPLWPELIGPRVTELGRLADMLGFHHDICVFEDRLGCLERDFEAASVAMQDLARQRRLLLEQNMEPLFARLLAQKAAAVVDHWRALWQIWRADAVRGQAGKGELET